MIANIAPEARTGRRNRGLNEFKIRGLDAPDRPMLRRN